MCVPSSFFSSSFLIRSQSLYPFPLGNSIFRVRRTQLKAAYYSKDRAKKPKLNPNDRPTIGLYIDASKPCTQSKPPSVHIDARAFYLAFFLFFFIVLYPLFSLLAFFPISRINPVFSNDWKSYAFLSLIASWARKSMHKLHIDRIAKTVCLLPLLYRKDFVSVNSLELRSFIHLCFAFCVCNRSFVEC